MFEKEAIRHAFEVTIGLGCLIKPAEEFTYEELNDNLQEKADDFQDGAEFGYNKAKEEMQAQIEKMKCCENCKRYKPCVTCNETIGNNCDYYSGGNVCDKWEIKEND